MFKVLGCFSADRAAQYTVNRNIVTNELSLFSKKDGNPICFFKDHKVGDPMREISDASRSPGHKLAKTLNKIFDTYTQQTKTAVNGGKQLIQFIREGRFNGNFLGSCDAVALYPSIIVEEGLELLERKILEDEDLGKQTCPKRSWQS